MVSNFRTSKSHPLKIDILSVNPQGGCIGMTFCPGKYQPTAATGAWNRDLDMDLRAIVGAGATTLISLLEPLELESLHVTDLPAKASSLGLTQYTLAIPDGGIPSAIFDSLWKSIGREIRDSIRNGELVIIHCKGGLGRTGLLAATICVELGVDPKLAIEHVRMTRPGAIETVEQERYAQRAIPVTDYAKDEKADDFVKISLKDEFLKTHNLPDIDYPIPITKLAGKNDDFQHSLTELLFYLQAYSAYDPNSWRELDPAIIRISELLSSDNKQMELHIGTEKWYLELGEIDLTGKIITLQRQGRLIAAIQPTEEGKLKITAYAGLDAMSVSLLTVLGQKPNNDGKVCMRDNNWEYALDSSVGNGQYYAAERGEVYLSYWEDGLGLSLTNAPVLSWYYQQKVSPINPVFTFSQLGTRENYRSSQR